MEVLSTPTVKAAAISASHPLASVLADRANVFEMTQQAETAALAPSAPGGLSHALRAAIACRVARINGETGLSAHFEQQITGTDETSRAIADPNFDGARDARLQALLRHADRVTRAPKSVVAADIDALKAAGIGDDDIVRLSQLVAFVNYQVRVSRGLQLMADAS